MWLNRVWIAEEPADSAYSTHFLGMLDDYACWGVDVPRGEDPSDGERWTYLVSLVVLRKKIGL